MNKTEVDVQVRSHFNEANGTLTLTLEKATRGGLHIVESSNAQQLDDWIHGRGA